MRISDWSSDVCSSDLRLSGVVEFDSLRLAIGLGRLARVALHQDDLVLLHHPAALPWIPRERAGEPLAADIRRPGNARVVDHCARDREIEFIPPRLHPLRLASKR